MRQQGRSHEGRAVFLVEAAGGLERGHLLGRRQLDGQRRLDGQFLLAREVEQVEPDGVVRQTPIGRRGLEFETRRAAPEQVEHAGLRQVVP
jgi:hypothetical protein